MVASTCEARPIPVWGRVSAIWGMAGVIALLAFAVYRLSRISFASFGYEYAWWHWAVLVVNSSFMAHGEGYRGFQKSFAPRAVARARYLLRATTPWRTVLAPLFCMGYFHTTRRRLISAYALTIMIVTLIIVFQRLDQPLRGALDFGVVVGLTWGLASIAWFIVQACTTPGFHHSPELPGS